MTISQMATESDRMLEVIRQTIVEEHFRKFQIAAIKFAVRFFSDGVFDEESNEEMSDHAIAIVDLGEPPEVLTNRKNEIVKLVKKDIAFAIKYLESIKEEK